MDRPVPLFGRIVLIGGAVGLMLVGILYLVPTLRDLTGGSDYPPVTHTGPPSGVIAAEAYPYRSRPGELAVAPDVAPREQAQPRTMEIHRTLRAYPGAPPRIPHGLTDREFRETRCNSCHERGGFVPRFGTYAPVTPHPEFTGCLQCHAPDNPIPTLVSIDWQPAEWPELGQRAMEGSPVWIPHRLQLRENCLACHGGPSAVAEIRTTHPERTDCRSCHVPIPDDETSDVFTRPLDGSAGGPR